MWLVTREDCLCHYGVKGQKKGNRRYITADGHYTPLGMERKLESYYYVLSPKQHIKIWKRKNETEYRISKVMKKISDNEISKIPAVKRFNNQDVINPFTTYSQFRNDSFITIDDYRNSKSPGASGPHTDDGKMINIASADKSRSSGDTDYLLRQAIRKNQDTNLLAEVTKDNKAAIDLMERNGFKVIDEIDDTLYFERQAGVPVPISSKTNRVGVKKIAQIQQEKHAIKHTAIMKDNEDQHFGLPDKKKFPLPDRAHVLSAIKFFNYAKPTEEAQLARAIKKRMKELGMTEVNVGPDNRFGKYYNR